MKRPSSKELTPLSQEEAKIYFSSEWYKNIMKSKRLKLIDLGFIKQPKKALN